MSVPYTPGMIARILRLLSDPDLAAITAERFQLWPARNIVPGAVVAELIRNERGNRRLAA